MNVIRLAMFGALAAASPARPALPPPPTPSSAEAQSADPAPPAAPRPTPAPDPLFNAEGYRASHYRTPASRPPEGVRRIAPAAAAALKPGRDAIFIDVLPAEGAHLEADGRWRLAAPHESIPGGAWFPEAGRGTLAPDIAPWFAAGVRRLTQGRRDRMLILFCRSDCWMGWNAARRLARAGYRNVWWLAEGTDGWRELGLPLRPAIPDGGIASSAPSAP